MQRPDPYTEIRLAGLRSLRGTNFWSARPVTRMDVAVGAYDDIHSADVPGFTDALVGALPGLWEHRCSIGERGGFVTRLRQGTYAPHIAEHVGLELQTMAGHDVGYGRARGGDRPGEYTVVFEHLHAQVGLRSAALALEIVQRAFAGELREVDVGAAVAELRALAATPDAPPLTAQVLCGITGGGDRAAVRNEMLRRGGYDPARIVDVAPVSLLEHGLPYARSDIAVVLDAQPNDVPARYREDGRNVQLVSALADAVRRNGIVVVPSTEWEVQESARRAWCRVAVFSTDGAAGDARGACAVALVRDGRVVIHQGGETVDGGAVVPGRDSRAQVAAALAVHALNERTDENGRGAWSSSRRTEPDAA